MFAPNNWSRFPPCPEASEPGHTRALWRLLLNPEQSDPSSDPIVSTATFPVGPQLLLSVRYKWLFLWISWCFKPLRSFKKDVHVQDGPFCFSSQLIRVPSFIRKNICIKTVHALPFHVRSKKPQPLIVGQRLYSKINTFPFPACTVVLPIQCYPKRLWSPSYFWIYGPVLGLFQPCQRDFKWIQRVQLWWWEKNHPEKTWVDIYRWQRTFLVKLLVAGLVESEAEPRSLTYGCQS